MCLRIWYGSWYRDIGWYGSVVKSVRPSTFKIGTAVGTEVLLNRYGRNYGDSSWYGSVYLFGTEVLLNRYRSW